jgi:hypothetical protein
MVACGDREAFPLGTLGVNVLGSFVIGLADAAIGWRCVSVAASAAPDPAGAQGEGGVELTGGLDPGVGACPQMMADGLDGLVLVLDCDVEELLADALCTEPAVVGSDLYRPSLRHEIPLAVPVCTDTL